MRTRRVLFSTAAMLCLLLCAAPSWAASTKTPTGFNVDLAFGKVMVNAQSENTDEIWEARLDYRASDHIVFTGGVARQTLDEGYDYQLVVGLETHLFQRNSLDPYISVGTAVHEVDVDNTTKGLDYGTWHVGAGLDIHFTDQFGLAIDGKLARPWDQEDGEERIEITAGLIIGG